jgi:hypothetical protein
VRVNPHPVAQLGAVFEVAGEATATAVPILVVESTFVLGERGQASFVHDALRLLLSKRRAWWIAGADGFTWRDGVAPDPHCAFCEGAGLLDREGRPKPAWWAFRQFALGAQL